MQSGKYPQVAVIVGTCDDSSDRGAQLGGHRSLVEHLEIGQFSNPLLDPRVVGGLGKLIPCGRMNEDPAALFHSQAHERRSRSESMLHLPGKRF